MRSQCLSTGKLCILRYIHRKTLQAWACMSAKLMVSQLWHIVTYTLASDTPPSSQFQFGIPCLHLHMVLLQLEIQVRQAHKPISASRTKDRKGENFRTAVPE